MATPVRPLVLTRDECYVLTDSVYNQDYGIDEQWVNVRVLILKLASLYLELVKIDAPNNEATIWVTEPETWLLRSKMNTSFKTSNQQHLGIQLLRKLYEVLLQFDAETSDLLIAEEIETMSPERKESLRLWNEAHNAAERAAHQDHPDDSPTDGTPAPA